MMVSAALAVGERALHHRRTLKKYLHVVNIGIQNQLVYRVNYLARVLFGFVNGSVLDIGY